MIWAVALTVLVCLLMALAVVDHIGIRVSGRSWLPWRRNERSRVLLSTGLDQVTALFYATKHYELEQRKTEFVLREESGDRAPRRLRLDLEDDRPTIVVQAARSAPTDPEPGG
jgi:hypothetical protein